jgi:hypothetical protein
LLEGVLALPELEGVLALPEVLAPPEALDPAEDFPVEEDDLPVDDEDLPVEAPAPALFIASNSERLSCPSLFVSSLSKSMPPFAFEPLAPAEALPLFGVLLPAEALPLLAALLPVEALPEDLASPLCDIDGFAEESLWAFLSSAACAAKASREKLTSNGVTNFIRTPGWMMEKVACNASSGWPSRSSTKDARAHEPFGAPLAKWPSAGPPGART